MNIAIWGAGKFGLYVGMQLKGKQNITCYIDNNAGNIPDIMGVTVVSPDEYMTCYSQRTDIVLVAVLDWYMVYEQLRAMNVKKYGIISRLVYYFKLDVSDDVLCNAHIIYREELEDKKVRMKKLETNVVDFCNLDCKGCSHFSNLFTKGDTAGYESFEKDICFLSDKVFVEHFDLLGGEAFLSGDLEKYIGCLKKYMPKTSITIVSNGVLIPVQSAELLSYIRENGVLVSITEYPPTTKLKEKITAVLEDSGVMYEFRRKVETFGKNIDLDGKSNPYQSQKECREYKCHFLRNGKIYKCPFSALGNYFFDHYNIPLHFEEGIDIYDSGVDFSNVLETLDTEPIEQCKYCGKEKRFEWSVSRKPECSEWVIN